MGNGLTQGINDTTLYVEKKYFRNFRQELNFKCKTDQLVKEKLCLGNLSYQWTASKAEKTGLYGNIYDFVVDYEQILGVKPIYDMHRYLMTKHNISL